MEHKHTAGPWEVEYDEDNLAHVIRMATAIETNGWRYQVQHQVEFSHGLDSTDEQFEEAEANAVLMAASPDLFEALQAMLTIDDWTDECIAPRAVIKRARAALAKAQGGAR